MSKDCTNNCSCREYMIENAPGDYVDSKGELAKELFEKGYNCCQAVLCAFCDDICLDEKEALRLSSSFGGGMGRLREVCGAVTAMFMIAGIKYGYSDVNDPKAKEEHYRLIQKLGENFREKNHSIICRELLGLDVKTDTPVPSERTKEYYQSRPCSDLVRCGAEIIANEIKRRYIQK